MVYGPVAGFILSSGKFVFLLFLASGLFSLFKDSYKGIAAKVSLMAVVCTVLAWWPGSSGC